MNFSKGGRIRRQFFDPDLKCKKKKMGSDSKNVKLSSSYSPINRDAKSPAITPPMGGVKIFQKKYGWRWGGVNLGLWWSLWWIYLWWKIITPELGVNLGWGDFASLPIKTVFRRPFLWSIYPSDDFFEKKFFLWAEELSKSSSLDEESEVKIHFLELASWRARANFMLRASARGDTENGRRGRKGRSYLFQYIGSFAQLNLLLFLKYFFTF